MDNQVELKIVLVEMEVMLKLMYHLVQ